MFKKLRELINSESRENVSNTQDIVLAEFLDSALQAFERGVIKRDELSGRKTSELAVAQNSTSNNKAMDAIALLREWVDDPGGKVCNDLYQRSRDWLAQQHQ